MTKKQADTYCEKINKLQSVYTSKPEKVGKYIRGHPFIVVVIHAQSGNEVGVARDTTEVAYIYKQISERTKAKCTQ